MTLFLNKKKENKTEKKEAYLEFLRCDSIYFHDS